MNKKIYVQSLTKERVPTSYNNGDDPDRREIVIHETVGKLFDNFETAVSYLSDFDLPYSKEEYVVFEGGRISYSRLENENGNPPSGYEYEQFKDGKLELWNAEYDVYLTLVQEEDSSQTALAEFLKVPKYN